MRAQADRDLGRDFLEREIEDLAGGRVAERRDQHDVAVVETLADRVGVDAAHLAGQEHVDAVDDAHRLRRDEVARRHTDARAGHRRVRDAKRQQGLDPAPHLASRLEHAVHRLGIGDPQPECIPAFDVLLGENRLDLRARAVDDDEMHTEAVQQVQVVDDAEERLVSDHLAAECDDERLAAERVDVGRGQPDPLDERARGRGMRGRCGDGRGRHQAGASAGRTGPVGPADYSVPTGARSYN